MKYKAIILSLSALSILSVPLIAQAHSNPDQVKTCYTFSGNTLKQKQRCVFSSGGGAGGMYQAITIGKKTYTFETACGMDGCEDYDYYYIGNQNPVNVSWYLRNPTTYKKRSESKTFTEENSLSCFKTKNGSLDMCTN